MPHLIGIKLINSKDFTMQYLDSIISQQKSNIPTGITSICSSHPMVLEAAVKFSQEHVSHLLVESTSNQVNQFGGYTGMQPPDFVRFMAKLAQKYQLLPEQLTLGGDHLGPLVWHKDPANRAMNKAATLVKEYVKAGYTKIHLDCSMPLGDDTDLPVALVAERTAILAKVAETSAEDPSTLRYIVGSEVPAAGGTKDAEEILVITSATSAQETIQAIKFAFMGQQLDDAWSRVRGLVVQPGVEFGETQIHDYDRRLTRELTSLISQEPDLVFEAHSTDYQTRSNLRALVEDHFAILKVGPGLTFALREGLLALAMIENQLMPDDNSRLLQVLEQSMIEDPNYWKEHYHGTPDAQRLSRLFSFSDRIRYYWAMPKVDLCVNQLLINLEKRGIPLNLVGQFLPAQFRKVRSGELTSDPIPLLLDKVNEVLADYAYAISPN
jgi:D-tagatose-1,6-bisphosphate aldolase subunit GatZ/KbaZ